MAKRCRDRICAGRSPLFSVAMSVEGVESGGSPRVQDHIILRDSKSVLKALNLESAARLVCGLRSLRGDGVDKRIANATRVVSAARNAC